MTQPKRGPTKERKPKLTYPERYKRLLDAAKEVGASDDPEDFNRAFMRVAATKEDRAPGLRPQNRSRRNHDEEDSQ
jgi:hypothetical protein